jgi:hypothetical protein
VRRIERRLHLLGFRERSDGPNCVVDRGPERRILHRQLLRLQEHHLALLVDALAVRGDGEAGALDDLVGLARLADVCVVLVDGRGPELHAEEHGRDDEGQPAGDGGLPVTGAPAAHAGRQALRMLQR